MQPTVKSTVGRQAMLATTRAARSQANVDATLQRYAAYAAEVGSQAWVVANAQA
jgi:hypothetical protein